MADTTIITIVMPSNVSDFHKKIGRIVSAALAAGATVAMERPKGYTVTNSPNINDLFGRTDAP